MRNRKTNIPFLYKTDTGYIVIVPLPIKGKKHTVGRFTEKVNAFIALNEALFLLYPSSAVPLQRLVNALRRRKRVNILEQLRLFPRSKPAEAPSVESIEGILDRESGRW